MPPPKVTALPWCPHFGLSVQKKYYISWKCSRQRLPALKKWTWIWVALSVKLAQDAFVGTADSFDFCKVNFVYFIRAYTLCHWVFHNIWHNPHVCTNVPSGTPYRQEENIPGKNTTTSYLPRLEEEICYNTPWLRKMTWMTTSAKIWPSTALYCRLLFL